MLKPIHTLFDSLKLIKPLWSQQLPLSFEDIYLRHGYQYLESEVLTRPQQPSVLELQQLNDRAHVFINNRFQTILTRRGQANRAPLVGVRQGDTIGLLVENQGHGCCEHSGAERKVRLGEWKG